MSPRAPAAYVRFVRLCRARVCCDVADEKREHQEGSRTVAASTDYALARLSRVRLALTDCFRPVGWCSDPAASTSSNEAGTSSNDSTRLFWLFCRTFKRIFIALESQLGGRARCA